MPAPYPYARSESPFHPHARKRRAVLAATVIGVMVIGLGSAFFNTQVLRNTEFMLRAEDNRFSEITLPAPRGTIYDRNGAIIAETVTGHALSLEPAPPDSLRARLRRLGALLELDSAEYPEILARAAAHPLEPATVAEALTFRQLSRLQEGQERHDGVITEARPLRRYPYGEAVAHLVGYVGEISAREMESPTWEGYRRGQQIGKSGVERAYEKQVGGKSGVRFVEVDARGRVVGRFAEQLAQSPVAGRDLHLTIDLDLQRYAEAIFPAGFRGAVVALVPGTSEVLALHSSPSYDPNQLTGRIPPRLWRELNTSTSRPLLNRATQGIYPPGSTWKLATAIIALERGLITPQERMPISCTGGMAYAGRYSRCWKPEGHGSQDLYSAIANSCNVYFYQLGIKLQVNGLATEGTRLGFSRKTGIELPGERVGIFPANREWYRKRFGHLPPPSEVMNLAIGQGPNSQTPLRMAQFFSALASEGRARRPHLERGVIPDVETDLRLDPKTLRAVHQGMARVIEAGGTAHAVELRHWKLYGKTGTSQNAQDLRRPHAWFTGFAGPRGGKPEIAVAVVVEFGESGSGAAAPIASRVADYYLRKKHGMTREMIETASRSVVPRRGASRRRAPATEPAPVAPPRDLAGPTPQE